MEEPKLLYRWACDHCTLDGGATSIEQAKSVFETHCKVKHKVLDSWAGRVTSGGTTVTYLYVLNTQPIDPFRP